MSPTIIASLISTAGMLAGIVLTNQYQLRRQTKELKAHLDQKSTNGEATRP